MWLFLLLWLLAMTIVFSIEIVLGFYWFQFGKENIFFSNNILVKSFDEKYLTYLDFFSWWIVSVPSFLSGVFFGWFIEKNFKILSKVNFYWQRTQPEFYINTSGEKRVLLPWFIIELPLLIIAIVNLFLLVFFEGDTLELMILLFFTIGFTVGQLVEKVKEYLTTIEMDRPEQENRSIIEKINPKFPREYSLFFGQFYAKIAVPFFFLYMTILLPGWFVIIPNHNDRNMLIIMSSLLLGIMFRWRKDIYNDFYFGKIHLNTILFIIIKVLALLSLITFVLVKFSNLFLLAFVCVICGFIIPWHPEKLRR